MTHDELNGLEGLRSLLNDRLSVIRKSGESVPLHEWVTVAQKFAELARLEHEVLRDFGHDARESSAPPKDVVAPATPTTPTDEAITFMLTPRKGDILRSVQGRKWTIDHVTADGEPLLCQVGSLTGALLSLGDVQEGWGVLTNMRVVEEIKCMYAGAGRSGGPADSWRTTTGR